MADLSMRFMGIGDEHLRRTIELNQGLLPGTGRVPVHPFPQGKFRQGKTPRVSKGKVCHHNCASICEVVFTDTFETGDYKFRYRQAFVDYCSRWGEVVPLRSRLQVGWSFGEFCCRSFTPLILIRNNIIENVDGDLLAECHRGGFKRAYLSLTTLPNRTKRKITWVTSPRWHRMPWFMPTPPFSFGDGEFCVQFLYPTSLLPTTVLTRKALVYAVHLGLWGAVPGCVCSCSFWLFVVLCSCLTRMIGLSFELAAFS